MKKTGTFFPLPPYHGKGNAQRFSPTEIPADAVHREVHADGIRQKEVYGTALQTGAAADAGSRRLRTFLCTYVLYSFFAALSIAEEKNFRKKSGTIPAEEEKAEKAMFFSAFFRFFTLSTQIDVTISLYKMGTVSLSHGKG